MQEPPSDTPATVTQLAAAMAALGAYAGTNSAAEHAAKMKRVGSAPDYGPELGSVFPAAK